MINISGKMTAKHFIKLQEFLKQNKTITCDMRLEREAVQIYFFDTDTFNGFFLEDVNDFHRLAELSAISKKEYIDSQILKLEKLKSERGDNKK